MAEGGEVPVRADVERIRVQGYVIIDRLLSASNLRALRDGLAPHLDRERFGRNPFEGLRTERVYTLPALGKIFADLIEHPRILAICDAILQPNYLLTAAQAIRIHPGEVAQALHYDDSFYPFPRPRPPISLATIFALDAFTAENGATEIIPGSHRWGDEVPRGVVTARDFAQRMTYGRGLVSPATMLMREAPPERTREDVRLEPVIMPAGSVVVFLGTLWHRGGANRSAAPRLAISTQYCEAWARQQENFTLGVPREVARGLSDRVLELLGYNIHPPFMGHVGGVHPKRLLHDAGGPGEGTDGAG
jgi:ectoine hydroxylase-related dioxygenase (phytanoyl-CoA dioxygenase family)